MIATQGRPSRRPWQTAAAALVVGVLWQPGIASAQDPSTTEPASLADYALPSDAGPGTDAVSDVPVAPAETFDPLARLDQLTTVLDAIPAERWDVAALAATFEGDPERAFAFVRDHIGFDPYRGVLRGAEGTLAAQAGSAADRAELLGSLLRAMGFTTRFAFADLDAATADRLVERSLQTPESPLEGPTAFDAIDRSLAQTIVPRARRDFTLLTDALGDSIAAIPGDPETADAEESLRHTWVQLERDGQWVDLDPSFGDAAFGTPLVTASATADEIAPEERATVTIRVHAENLVDGAIVEQVVLEQTLDAAAAARSQVLLAFQPAGGGGGGLLGGGDLLGGGGGPPSAYEPLLLVDGVTAVGVPIPVLPSGDALGGGGDVRLSRLALELVSEAPGRAPRVSERILLDRVPQATRAAGAWSADDLGPMPVVEDLPSVMTGIHHVMVSNGSSNANDALESSVAGLIVAEDALASNAVPADVGLGTSLLPLTSTDGQLVLASEHAIVAGLDESVEGRTFIGRPRVFLVSLTPDPTDPTSLDLTTDLAIDEVDVVGPTDEASAATQRLWYGAAQTALETEFILRAAEAFDPGARQLLGVSFAMGLPLTVVSDVAEAAGAAPAMLAAVESGAMAVVPGDVASARTWWTISKADGLTRSILDPGVRAGGVIGPPVFYAPGTTPLDDNWIRWSEKTVARRRCGGGQESQAVTNCASLNAMATTEQMIEQYIILMRRVAQFLV